MSGEIQHAEFARDLALLAFSEGLADSMIDVVEATPGGFVFKLESKGRVYRVIVEPVIQPPKITVRTLEQCAINNANENGIGAHRYTGKDNLTLRCQYWEGRAPDEFRWVLVGPLGSEFTIDEDEAARRLEEWQS